MATFSSQIGAYYFPGYHADPRISQWHGEGWSEWALLRAAGPRFPGHAQPKVPLWGWEDEADPAVMAKKAQAAATHGLSHFIFDWYHYEGRPFLNRCLDDGFLKIPGGPPVRFALMWANHDWLNIQPDHLAGGAPVMASGAVDAAGFDQIAKVVIEQYFASPHYWTIQGRPYFSIYDLAGFIRGLGGQDAARQALTAFRTKVRAAGFPDLHLNLVHWQQRIVGSEALLALTPPEIISLGFDSISSYVWIHHFNDFTFPQTEFLQVLDHSIEYWRKTAAEFSVPYFPNVTMGWDASPRTCQTDRFQDRSYPFMATMKNNSPANFKRALEAVKVHLERHQVPLRHFSINAWNEWTEGSYLEPDQTAGFAYLEAIRDVFGCDAAG